MYAMITEPTKIRTFVNVITQSRSNIKLHDQLEGPGALMTPAYIKT
jgi:hypothetical protein